MAPRAHLRGRTRLPRPLPRLRLRRQGKINLTVPHVSPIFANVGLFPMSRRTDVTIADGCLIAFVFQRAQQTNALFSFRIFQTVLSFAKRRHASRSRGEKSKRT